MLGSEGNHLALAASGPYSATVAAVMPIGEPHWKVASGALGFRGDEFDDGGVYALNRRAHVFPCVNDPNWSFVWK
jgi:hypothetical protein